MGDAETPTASVQAAPKAGSALRGWLFGLLGWLVPGLGHLLQKKFDRAAVFFFSVTAMAGLGLGMGAKLYGPAIDRTQGAFVTLLHTLGFIGDLGVVLYFTAARFAGLGEDYLPRASGDYGTVFFLCAGLLNLLTAIDAFDIAVGKKE